MPRLKITMGETVLTVRTRVTPTADLICENLPFESAARTWGNEVYFETPVSAPSEPHARDVVEAGEIAFWEPGNCIAIGFGPTPVSRGDEIRLASPVNIWADAVEDVRSLNVVRDGDAVRVEALED